MPPSQDRHRGARADLEQPDAAAGHLPPGEPVPRHRAVPGMLRKRRGPASRRRGGANVDHGEGRIAARSPILKLAGPWWTRGPA